jgi:hypothetical protein
MESNEERRRNPQPPTGKDQTTPPVDVSPEVEAEGERVAEQAVPGAPPTPTDHIRPDAPSAGEPDRSDRPDQKD